ncbi:MAG: hypothetical protein E7580_02405 [Ruminococcaceae bacterium]|nr:hypothetical protein [Oscillospiraceae bacterium]
MEEKDIRKELLTRLSHFDLSRDEMLSVSLALANPEHTLTMIDFLDERDSLSVDEIFQKAGEIAFGKNS